MLKKSNFQALAVALIVMGFLLLLDTLYIAKGILRIWPLLTLILGTGFVMLFFKNKKKDLVLLGLGTFLATNSILFLYLNFTSWNYITHLWPLFIFLLGLTFLACYISSRRRTLIYLAVLLMAIGASFILIFAVALRLWPLSLIIAGASFMIINIFDRT